MISELDRDLERLRQDLLEDVPIDPDERSDAERARFALAHMMEFHRREDKASWWDYFRLLALEESELEDERRALGGLAHAETVEPGAAPLERYRFPPQDVDARPGDEVYGLDGTRVGLVAAVHLADRSIDVKKSRKTAGLHPGAVILQNHVRSDPLRTSLMRLGEAVLEQGLALGAPNRAATDLLLRRPPPANTPDGPLQRPGESTLEAACRIAVELDGHVLAIQGPPGTGKTYTGAAIIGALVRAGLKVGVTAVSHKVVVNLLEAAAQQARNDNLPMALVHRQKGQYEGAWGIERMYAYDAARAALANGTADVLGATAWCWARPDFAESVDVLVVDEAGQMSLANVLACAPAARSLILAGRSAAARATAPEEPPGGERGVRACTTLLGGADTMPPEQGLFRGETYRLHPDIARFTSEIYYEGAASRRFPASSARRSCRAAGHESDLWGSGLRYLPVAHDGNQARAPGEIDCIRRLIAELLADAGWRDRDGARAAAHGAATS